MASLWNVAIFSILLTFWTITPFESLFLTSKRGDTDVKRFIFLCLVGGLLTASSGCGLLQAVFNYRPCVTRGGGACGGCGECDDCMGPTCGPVRRAHRCDCDDCTVGHRCQRVRGCVTCGDCDSCDPCADPCGSGCFGRCWYRGPLSCVFALFTPNYWHGRACGERYWGDFYSDPPDCWDPCDCQGNYTGGSTMNYGSGHATGGCRNCARQSGSSMVGAGSEGMVRDERVVSDRVMTPATKTAQPHKAVRAR